MKILCLHVTELSGSANHTEPGAFKISLVWSCKILKLLFFYFHEIMASTNHLYIFIFLRLNKKKKKERGNLWTFEIYMTGIKNQKRTSWKRQHLCPLTHLLVTNKMLLKSIKLLFLEHFLMLFSLYRCIPLFYLILTSNFLFKKRACYHLLYVLSCCLGLIQLLQNALYVFL